MFNNWYNSNTFKMNPKDSQSVRNWLSRLAPSTQKMAEFHLNRWLEWTSLNGGELAPYSPDDFVEYQKTAGNGEQFKILDLAQSYILTQTGTYNYKKNMYAYIRSFFMHNRAELPRDRGFNIRGDKPKNRGDLKPEEIRDVILSSNPMYQAIFLSMLQGGMGQEELTYWNENGWESLKEHLKQESDIIRVDLPGRKTRKFEKGFYTLLGPDAIQAIRNYLPHRPGGADAIFIAQGGGPPGKRAIRTYWLRHLRKLGIVTPRVNNDDHGYRTGKGLHELRDSFRSLWEKTPAKASVAEFIMGHTVDPLEYNKAFRDEVWVMKEYRKALPMLQILSSGRPYGKVDEDEIEKLRRKNEELQNRLNGYEVSIRQEFEAKNDKLNFKYNTLEKMVKELLSAQRKKIPFEAENEE